jgi:hypothetical protein
MHSLFELVWRYRFIYRDLNDLLSKNRHVEGQMKDIVALKEAAFAQLLAHLHTAKLLQQTATERTPLRHPHGGDAHLVAEL